jgi:hypothetical protein
MHWLVLCILFVVGKCGSRKCRNLWCIVHIETFDHVQSLITSFSIPKSKGQDKILVFPSVVAEPEDSLVALPLSD